jgi:hypothetical protein
VSSAAAAAPRARTLPAWWPLAALLLLAAVLRFATLDLQSLWYDEAYTPVHVLRPSLFTTLHNVVRTENSPPLWYVLEWGWTRIFGTGAVALRFISALAGLGTVAAGWWIGRELAGRRAAIVLTALLAVNPLFVWYSQEARAYMLSAFFAALAFLWFLRAEREPSRRALAWWAGMTALALVSHYFTVFLAIPEAVVLLAGVRERRAKLLACGAVAVVGLALLPLIAAQGGHGTQWIGRWALSSRVQAIPQYWLTGESGAPLGHGVELLVLLVVGVGATLFVFLDGVARRACLLALSVGAAAILVPFALALMGADYLAPRNLLAAWVPLSAALAVPLACRREGWALAGLLCVMWLGVTLDVNASPRLQRGDWRGVAKRIMPPLQIPASAGFPKSLKLYGGPDAVVTPELGSAPLLYYSPRWLFHGPYRPAHGSVTVSSVAVIVNGPVSAARKLKIAALGARRFEVVDVHGIRIVWVGLAKPVTVTAAVLRRLGAPADKPEVLAPPPPSNLPIGG